MKSLNDIDRTTKEGMLLFAALAKITTESQTDKTPEEVLEQLSALADEIDAESIECADKGCVFTKDMVRTFVWLAFEAGKTEGRKFSNEIVMNGVKDFDSGISFAEFWLGFEKKVRPDYSIFENFNNK